MNRDHTPEINDAANHDDAGRLADSVMRAAAAFRAEAEPPHEDEISDLGAWLQSQTDATLPATHTPHTETDAMTKPATPRTASGRRATRLTRVRVGIVGEALVGAAVILLLAVVWLQWPLASEPVPPTDDTQNTRSAADPDPDAPQENVPAQPNPQPAPEGQIVIAPEPPPLADEDPGKLDWTDIVRIVNAAADPIDWVNSAPPNLRARVLECSVPEVSEDWSAADYLASIVVVLLHRIANERSPRSWRVPRSWLGDDWVVDNGLFYAGYPELCRERPAGMPPGAKDPRTAARLLRVRSGFDPRTPDLERAIELDPTYEVAMLLLAKYCLERNEDLDDALELANRAVSVHSSEAAVAMRVDIRIRQFNYERALPDLNALIAARPDTAIYRTQRASVYRALRQFDDARADEDAADRLAGLPVWERVRANPDWSENEQQSRGTLRVVVQFRTEQSSFKDERLAQQERVLQIEAMKGWQQTAAQAAINKLPLPDDVLESIRRRPAAIEAIGNAVRIERRAWIVDKPHIRLQCIMCFTVSLSSLLNQVPREYQSAMAEWHYREVTKND